MINFCTLLQCHCFIFVMFFSNFLLASVRYRRGPTKKLRYLRSSYNALNWSQKIIHEQLCYYSRVSYSIWNCKFKNREAIADSNILYYVLHVHPLLLYITRNLLYRTVPRFCSPNSTLCSKWEILVFAQST